MYHSAELSLAVEDEIKSMAMCRSKSDPGVSISNNVDVHFPAIPVEAVICVLNRVVLESDDSDEMEFVERRVEGIRLYKLKNHGKEHINGKRTANGFHVSISSHDEIINIDQDEPVHKDDRLSRQRCQMMRLQSFRIIHIFFAIAVFLVVFALLVAALYNSDRKI